ncbi:MULTISPECIES: cytochrome o ubiquinol oxidase subunit I [Psychrobacter]|uniref:cytochrome o ubiquinol oxidase subunit I n=1 Tax=Psychrobacter TaxID=497 RepID=UPI00097EDAD7|nr:MULTISPECIES: cytochrome o ubiquinol oxidase subunit I [Psychrobacter]SJN29347.1 Cytochrome O ubiquinol oxidase subunit I [Psychrobacter sp. JB385]
MEAILGRLSLEAIPYHEPIIMAAGGMMALVGLAVLIFLTKKKLWGTLWHDWLTSVDHKKIGIMYIVVAIVMLLRGFSDAIMMRTHQMLANYPETGYLPPHHYDQIFTAHGVIMIFFVAMPLVVGLMNAIVPLQIGARDVAFPFLNSLSFWLFVTGALLVNVSLVIGDFAATGWLAYPPLSELNFSPTVGVDYYIWALQLSGLGTLLTGVNFLVTILKMRAPGMNLMHMPIFTWSALCTNILIVAAFPVLTATLIMLTLDRYLGMHFFTNDAGGNVMMYINLIWIWGHPEVYILVLPAFGIFSEVISTFSQKKLFGYVSMVYAILVIAVLSFIVWLHHFFTMGSGANVNAFFGITTMIIAIPTGVKVFNWLFTMYRGKIIFGTPIMWTIGFIITFTVGGMTGVMLAVPGIDYVLHNSLFLIAHFHNTIIGGAVFGYFAGIAFWWPKMFGYRLDEKWGKRAFWGWIIGFFTAFMPLYVLGFLGMTRRTNHYANDSWQFWLIIAAIGAFIIMYGIFSQLMMFYVSYRDRERLADVSGDPWNGRTLEWSTPSPAPFYNFAQLPVINDLDALAYLKDGGWTSDKAPEYYSPIHMPKNTDSGVIIGLLTFVFGFAFVWHIWWLVIASFLVMVFFVIREANKRDIDYVVPVHEIEVTENAYYERLRTAHAGDGL